MESRKPPEFGLEVSADRSNIKDVIKGDYTSTAHSHRALVLTFGKGFFIQSSSIAILFLYSQPPTTYLT